MDIEDFKRKHVVSNEKATKYGKLGIGKKLNTDEKSTHTEKRWREYLSV